MKKFPGKTLKGRIVSVHTGNNEDLSKQSQTSLTAEIGGFAGDKHQGPEPMNQELMRRQTLTSGSE